MSSGLDNVRATAQAVVDFMQQEQLVVKLLQLEELLAAATRARADYAEDCGCLLPDLASSEGAATGVHTAIATFYPVGVEPPTARLRGIPRSFLKFLEDIREPQAA